MMHVISSHQKSKIDYLCRVNNLESVPKCLNCDKDVEISKHDGFSFNKWCSRSCQFSYINNERIKNGTHHLQSQNLKRDKEGRSILHTNQQLTASKNGTHHFLNKNLKRDPYGRSVIHTHDKNDETVLYIGVFKKESLFKVGKSTNIEERIKLFTRSNIIFDELITFNGLYSEISRIESNIHKRFKCYNIHLDKVKYPNDDFMRLGHTEWYDLKYYDEVLTYVRSIFN